MRQIIPFKKELLLTTKINEVTSISLEHTLSLKDNSLISGEFIVSGDYKMTATSVNREKFKFNLPVEIEMDASYDYEKAIVDIDNFYYEVVNDDTIVVNIDVYVDALKKEIIISDDDVGKETIVIDEDNKDVTYDTDVDEKSNKDTLGKKDQDALNTADKNNDRFDINIDSDINVEVGNINNSNVNEDKEEVEQVVSYKKPEKIDLDEVTFDKDIKEDGKVNFFNTDSFSNETYATYYVYVVKENDTIDNILDKFKITKEELANYNDINDIKKGNKLIIPISDEQ